ncbi:uncharacterized protein LOC126673321 [Mercurialis annua]|uniref:uncharacterized protein LOC126673321 n=1 Tax=Mercurialis annua TaxID=3986 RepID=UPI002160C1EA|nr:uncharacterized protein LOC126673321 [Mercurialis annua]XP_050223373.1 uncharacterized protein LOC126673321 [Mercurialis annua]
MECNKEEAFRAKELAENKMQKGDFAGARRIALKARQLYPDLDNISQLLMVCDVHCSAQNKLNGLVYDWYGILQIEKFSDELAVKKQFRKLALSLHPDKNKFAGAEAAFKLIGEANMVLTDPTKRSSYDMKYRCAYRPTAPKPPPERPIKNSSVKKQHVAPSKNSKAPHTQSSSSKAHQPPRQSTFWTSCPACQVRYQYYREYLNKMLRCQGCLEPFMAHELGVSPGSTQNQSVNEKNVPNQGPFKFVPQNHAANPSGVNYPHRYSGPDPMEKVEKTADVGGSKPEEVKLENATGTVGGSNPQEKVNEHVDGKAGNGGVPVSMTDGMKPKESDFPDGASNKRRWKSMEESSKNFYKSKKAGSEEKVSDLSAKSSGHQSRKSARQKQHNSYKETYDDDFVDPPSKRSRENSLSDAQIKEASLADKVPKDVSVGCTAPVLNRNDKEAKQKASSSLEERSSSLKSGEFKAKGGDTSMSQRVGTKSENVERSKTDTSESNSNEVIEPEVFYCADPDFNNFDIERAEGNFRVSQIWAIYDSCDGMPRFYAFVKKVHSPGFRLEITWLEPTSYKKAEQQWCNEDLPISCGRYDTGVTEETKDLLMFSHPVAHGDGGRKGLYFIYPKKGETWALFKDWYAGWSLEAEKHRPPYQFEFVEIVTDFSESIGIGVAYLGKVKGFVSIFQQVNCDGVLTFSILPNELYRFSHRVPSVRMSGVERVGVPPGSFELDTAALPSNFASMVNSEKNIGSGLEKSTGTRTDHNQVEASQLGDINKVPSQHMLNRPDGNNSRLQANENVLIDKKPEGKFIAVSLTPRRSPRDLSKRISQLNSNKNVAANQQASVTSCQPDDETHLQVKDGRFISPLKGSSSSVCRVVEIPEYDFKKERSKDKFQVGQIWAVHTDKDMLPRNYVRVKKIEKTNCFRLYVAMLEAVTLQNDTKLPVTCGIFKPKSGKPIVLLLNAFSHKVEAKVMSGGKYEIYPRKDEIWAIYKNWNSELKCSNKADRECDIVKVVEDNRSSVKVVVLKASKGDDTIYVLPTPKRLESSMIEIPRGEISRFSHQCSAVYQHVEEKNRPLKWYWQIDPLSVPGSVIVVE